MDNGFMKLPPPNKSSPKTSFGNYGNPKSHIPLGYGTGQNQSHNPETPNQGTRTHTYTHRFRNGTGATLTLPAFGVEWSGEPTPSLIPEYLEWRDQCLEHFAQITGQR